MLLSTKYSRSLTLSSTVARRNNCILPFGMDIHRRMQTGGHNLWWWSCDRTQIHYKVEPSKVTFVFTPICYAQL